MTKGGVNMFSFITFALALTPMGLFYEKQYLLAISAFILGLIIHLVIPTAVSLRKQSKWYRQYAYLGYPLMSIFSIIFGFLNFLLGQIILVVVYFFWTNAMWADIRRKLFPDNSLSEG